MRRSICICLLWIVVSFSLVCRAHGATKLADYGGGDLGIGDNRYVVWSGFDGSDNEIFLYDGMSANQITHNDYPDVGCRTNNDGHVAWRGCDGDTASDCSGGDWEIFLYDGTSTIQLTNNAYDDWSPQINDNGYVVWYGSDGTDDEIFLYDGTSTAQLTNNNYRDYHPQLNNNGQVVWERGVIPQNNEIILYDGTSTLQLTNNAEHDHDPRINDSGSVVWWGFDGSDFQIFLYDGSSTTQLTSTSYSNLFPQINALGHVAWRSENYRISLYDGTSTSTIGYGLDFELNDNGQLVWEMCYGDDDHGYCSGNYGIMFFDGVTTRPVTIPLSGQAVDPRLNNTGQIVWNGHGLSGGGIFLSEPGLPIWTITSTVATESQSASNTMNYFLLLWIPFGFVVLLKAIRSRG